MHHFHNNPIFVTAVRLIQQSFCFILNQNDCFFHLGVKKPNNFHDKSEMELELLTNKANGNKFKLIQNKFYLSWLISKNPELSQFRKMNNRY